MADVRFTDNSGETLNALEEAIKAALEAMGQQADSYAKSNITAAGRVATGALRNSVSHEVQAGEGAVYVGTNQDYAIYNELGTGIFVGGRQTPWSYQDANGNWHRTRGMAPIHFLKGAVQDHQSEYLAIAKKIIGEKMK